MLIQSKGPSMWQILRKSKQKYDLLEQIDPRPSSGAQIFPILIQAKSHLQNKFYVNNKIIYLFLLSYLFNNRKALVQQDFHIFFKLLICFLNRSVLLPLARRKSVPHLNLLKELYIHTQQISYISTDLKINSIFLSRSVLGSLAGKFLLSNFQIFTISGGWLICLSFRTKPFMYIYTQIKLSFIKNHKSTRQKKL